MAISTVQAGLLLDLMRLGRDMYREHKNAVVEGLPDVEGEVTLEQYALASGEDIFKEVFDGKTPEEIDAELDGITPEAPDDPVDEMGKEGEGEKRLDKPSS